MNRRLTTRELLPFAALLFLSLLVTDLTTDWFGEEAVAVACVVLGSLGLAWLRHRRRRNDVHA